MIPAEHDLPAPGPAVRRIPLAGLLGAAWGIAGLVAVLGYAIAKLAGYVGVALATGLGPAGLVLLAANVAFMVWAEGVRGFQRKFSPRVAARALALARAPDPVAVLLAPFFCAGYFRATPRVLRVTWLGTGLIVLAVLAFQLVPQPWRGVLDAGVVAGLAWGTATLGWSAWRAFRDQRPAVPDEIA